MPRRCNIWLLTLVLCLFPAPAWADADLDTMIGQMLMAGFRGLTVDKDSPIVRDIREYHLGGVILFDKDMTAWFDKTRNIRSPEQVRALIGNLRQEADIPLLVAVDQEGGKVQRLKAEYGFRETPSAKKLCASGEVQLRMGAYMVGTTLSSVGFNVDFAPVADVDVNPNSPAIGALERSFSSDPQQVTRCAELFVEELHRADVLSCLKHFPGHGSATGDSHKGVVDVTETWSEAELIPYRALIHKGEADMIMTAHIFNAHLDPDHPATLSKKVITGLLREALGFDGVVVTDDMDMGAITKQYGREEAVRLAIEAGADILLFGNNLTFDPDVVGKVHAIIRRLVDSGAISEARIRQSYERVQHLKQSLK